MSSPLLTFCSLFGQWSPKGYHLVVKIQCLAFLKPLVLSRLFKIYLWQAMEKSENYRWCIYPFYHSG